MEENQNIQIVPTQSPQGLYLLGLGKAIANLTPAVAPSYWFNGDTQYQQRLNMINEIHKKAMEVIQTLNNPKP